MERVEHIFGLINKMDIDGLIEQFADDVVMELPFAPGRMPKRYVGKAAAHDFMASVRDSFRSFAMTVDAVHETTDPRLVVVEHHADGVVAANGRTYDNRYVTFVTFDDDRKVRHWREYYDAGVVVRAFRASS